MGDIIKFSALNTKIKALEGKMLTVEEYKKLIETKDYKEALRFLKENTNYNDALKDYNIEDVHRGQVEYILKKYYINNLVKLGHFFNGNYKKMYKIFLMKYEIEDLKVIIRGKYLKRDNEEIRKCLVYKSYLNYIEDYEELLKENDIEGVIERLKDTPYYKHLANISKSYKTEGLFRIEMALDFSYFSSMRKIIPKLNKQDSEKLNQMLGGHSDLLNIQWIFRGKKYYKLTPELLFNYTIHDRYKLSLDDVKKMCYAKTINEFLDVVYNSYYSEIFKEKEEYLLENQILECIKNMFLKAKRENAMDISFAIAYAELITIEIRDITSIVEGKRYGEKPEEIFKYITVKLN